MYTLRVGARRQQGFTIIEVLAVIAVLAVGMAALINLFASIQIAQRNASYISIATHAAQTEIARLRTTDFNSIRADGTYPFSQLPSTLPPDSTGTITVSTPSNASTSRQVNATVTYKIGTLQKQVTVSAYIEPPEVSL